MEEGFGIKAYYSVVDGQEAFFFFFVKTHIDSLKYINRQKQNKQKQFRVLTSRDANFIISCFKDDIL